MQGLIQNAEIILASKSPRRRRLLKTAGLRFAVVPSNIRENDFTLSGDPIAYAGELAAAKARDAAKRFPEAWVIGADSIVVVENRLLEKPETMEDARQMLTMLSGNTHQVHTGYAVVCINRGYDFGDVVTTAVEFKALTRQEIEWYIRTPEPYDKAGGYAIQGLGAFMIKQIRGSYTNVVGLPLCEVIDRLSMEGVIDRQTAPANTNLSERIN